MRSRVAWATGRTLGIAGCTPIQSSAGAFRRPWCQGSRKAPFKIMYSNQIHYYRIDPTTIATKNQPSPSFCFQFTLQSKTILRQPMTCQPMSTQPNIEAKPMRCQPILQVKPTPFQPTIEMNSSDVQPTIQRKPMCVSSIENQSSVEARSTSFQPTNH